MTPARTKSIIEGFALIAAGLIPIIGIIWVLS
jgi:nitrate reductase NapE component